MHQRLPAWSASKTSDRETISVLFGRGIEPVGAPGAGPLDRKSTISPEPTAQLVIDVICTAGSTPLSARTRTRTDDPVGARAAGTPRCVMNSGRRGNSKCALANVTVTRLPRLAGWAGRT